MLHLWLRFITFGGRSAHLAYRVHKRGRTTSIIIMDIVPDAGHNSSFVSVCSVRSETLVASDLEDFAALHVCFLYTANVDPFLIFIEDSLSITLHYLERLLFLYCCFSASNSPPTPPGTVKRIGRTSSSLGWTPSRQGARRCLIPKGPP